VKSQKTLILDNTPLLRVGILIAVLLLITTACSTAQPTTSATPDGILASEGLLSGPKKDSSEPTPKASNQVNEPTQVNTSASNADSTATPISESETPVPATEIVEVAPTPDPTEAEPLPPVAPKVGYLAPDFSLLTLEGETISLSELRGKYVLINYWASWCNPCIEELEALENIHRSYQGTDFVLLSVNGIEQDSLNKVLSTVAEHEMSFPVMLDEGEVFWKSYQVLFLPTSFFIDERGIIRQIKFGGDSEADFRESIEDLLNNRL